MIEFSSPILIQSSEMGEITAISAGREFSLFLNDQGQVFGLGANNCGQLGIGEFSGHFSVRLPTKLDESRMIGRIVAISAGDTHSLVLNSQGQVYSFGANKHHQLGFGDTVGLCHPTLVKSPEIGEIVSISAGSTNSLMINSQGQFLTCGYLEMSEAKWAKSPTVFFNQ
jgi:alpha-tubulin suppressor-like RCC1 family protein